MLNIDNIKLISGLGDRDANELCVMSLTALIANEPHTDRPMCACPVLTAAAIRLNDGPWWASDEDRTAALKPLSAELVGTRTTDAVALRRAGVFVDLALHVWAPKALDYAASLHPLEEHRSALMLHASRLREDESAARAAYAADDAYAADRAARAAAAARAADAAAYAAYAAYAAARAADAAAYAAYAADRAARAADAAAYAAYAAYAADRAARASAYAAGIRDELLAAIRSAIAIVD